MAITDLGQIERWYRSFAEKDAAGRSPLYAALSARIAEDADVLGFLADFPVMKRQPNLLFASFRSLFGTPKDWSGFKSQLLAGRQVIAARMMERSTQTNEPARCSTLLPLLARLPQPLALIEVGAAAGLCLGPDRYGYDYGERCLMPDTPDENIPVFKCRTNPATPIPTAIPRVSWRAGLDLNPLDLSDENAMQWLEILVWPGQEDRAENLRRAIAVLRRDPPRIVQGDLTTDLARLCAEIPTGLTRVVFHSVVLSYVWPQEVRDQFATSVSSLADFWLSNEPPEVFPEIAARTAPGPNGYFLLSQNGEPIAWTDPHGAAMEWIEN